MTTWKDIVSFQSNTAHEYNDNSNVYVLFVNFDHPTSPNVALTITKNKVELSDYVIHEDQIEQEIKDIFNSFNEVKITSSVDLERQKINIAKTSRRGFANINFNNVWFYKGDYLYDSPVYVIQDTETKKYAILKNPNFQLMGFKIKQKENT